MCVEVFVEGLRVNHIPGEGVHAVESAVQRVVVSCAEVVLLRIGIELFAGVLQVRILCAGIANRYAISVVELFGFQRAIF